MTDMPAAHLFQRAIAAAAIVDGAGPDAHPGGQADVPIGVISAIAGASSRVLLDRSAIAPLFAHPDAVLALRTVRRALLRSASRRNRLLGRFWPASLVTGAGGRLAARVRERLTARVPARPTGRTGTV